MKYYFVTYHWKSSTDGRSGSNSFEVEASSQIEAEVLARRRAELRSPGRNITEIRVTPR